MKFLLVLVTLGFYTGCSSEPDFSDTEKKIRSYIVNQYNWNRTMLGEKQISYSDAQEKNAHHLILEKGITRFDALEIIYEYDQASKDCINQLFSEKDFAFDNVAARTLIYYQGMLNEIAVRERGKSNIIKTILSGFDGENFESYSDFREWFSKIQDPGEKTINSGEYKKWLAACQKKNFLEAGINEDMIKSLEFGFIVRTELRK